MAATISGMDGLVDIAVFSRERKDWLREHLELPNGLPSADTYARIFATTDPQAFMDCFTAMVASRCPALEGELVVGEKSNEITAVPQSPHLDFTDLGE